jgi:hypothetical protein
LASLHERRTMTPAPSSRLRPGGGGA